MYRPGATAREAQAVGLTLEEASGPPIQTWPDTEQSILVFDAFGSQWNYAGMAGLPTGLDYGKYESILRGMGIKRAAWVTIFPDIRVMEAAALEEMHRQYQLRAQNK